MQHIKNMKAVFAVPGPHGGIFERRDISVPSPAADDVLIAVRASGTNRGEPIQHLCCVLAILET
jgi:NADPH:quinone reductase-like Zn-dependent oxidoreductase